MKMMVKEYQKIVKIDKFLYVCIVLLNSIISSKMEPLKYLELNVRPYSCGCDHCLDMPPDFVDLTYHLSDQNSLSCLETLIIGRKIFIPFCI